MYHFKYPLASLLFLFTVLSLSGQESADSSLVITLGAIKKVAITTAECGGIISNSKSENILSAGLCWDTKPNPLISGRHITTIPDSNVYTLVIRGLGPDSLYFVRAYAITFKDTAYSNTGIFYTHSSNAVSDVDDNYYNFVKIGNQVWLAEDLKTTRLNDCTNLLKSTGPEYITTSLPQYSWYGNDSANFSFPRGLLYNWYSVNTGKLCPQGWHVPSNEEWEILRSFLGGDTIAGGKLKTPGTMLWQYPNLKASNSSRFNAFPTGYRNAKGDWVFAKIFAHWWSKDESTEYISTSWFVYYLNGYFYNQIVSKRFGYAVRCIRDAD